MRDKEWLKLTRMRLHLTMQDIANEMFVTKQTISQIENGKVQKSSTMLLYEKVLEDHLQRTPLKELTESELEIWKEVISVMEMK